MRLPLFTLAVAVICVTTGCSINPYAELSVDMPPLRSSGAVSIEEPGGNLICVTEGGDPATRTCVPKVHEDSPGAGTEAGR